MTFALELEKYREYGIAEGEAKGRAEGRAEGETRSKLESIRSLMANMKWSAQQAMQALNIPTSEYEKYLAMI